MTTPILLGPRLGPELLMPLTLVCTLLGEFSPIPCSRFLLVCFTMMMILCGMITHYFLQHRLTPIFALVSMYCIGMLATQQADYKEDPLATFTVLRLTDVQTTAKGIHATGQIYKHTNSGWVGSDHKANCYVSGQTFPLKNGILIATSSLPVPIKNNGNPGSFEIETFYKSKGIRVNHFIRDSIVILGKRSHFRDFMKSQQQFLGERMGKYVHGKELALAKALILGDVSDIESNTRDDFSATGAIHVLAVSGMHISLFAQILLMSFQFFSRWISRKKAILLILVILWFYALLTGFSPSVIRSVFMFTLFQIGTFWGLKANSNAILFFSAWVLLLVSPYYIYDIGFQLSYLAVFGILNYHGKIKSIWQPKNIVLGYFWEATSVSMAAQLFTVPLTLYHFHYFPNYFLLANLGITLISSLAMYIGFAYLFLQEIPFIQEILGFSFQWTLKTMTQFIHFVANLDGSVEAGFDLSIGMVFAMVLSVLWFFHVPLRSITLKTLPMLAVIVAITYGRYKHQNTEHLMLLNSKRPVFILNNKGNGTVFFTANHENRKNLERLKGEYEKIYPIKHWQLREIKERQSYRAQQCPLTIENHHNVYKVEFRQKKYILRRKPKNASHLQWEIMDVKSKRTTALRKAEEL